MLVIGKNNKFKLPVHLFITLLYCILPIGKIYADSNDVTASAEISTYEFITDQSSVHQTGGFAGVDETYSIQGQFQLCVDFNDGSASFERVDANLLKENGSVNGNSLEEVFNMTKLSGIVINDTLIVFIGQAFEEPETDIIIVVILSDDSAYLAGQSIPPTCCDYFYFDLDAVAKKIYSGGGTGKPNDPYKIATAEDLILLGENPEDYDKHFILTNDIDLSDWIFDKAIIASDTNPANWRYQGTSFTGIFDCNGYTISNMTIQGESYLGLFGKLGSEAQIYNLDLENVDVNGTGDYIASLASINDGSITNCYLTGTVSGHEHAGGFVCKNDGSITNCSSTGLMTGSSNLGGLVSENTGVIISSHSTVIITGDYNVGGLVFMNNEGIINKSYSNGIVTGGSSVGGLVGFNYLGSIITCYSTVAVIGSENTTGGLVAQNAGPVIASYSTGAVIGTNQIGGLIGENAGKITACFSTSNVIGQASVGGLIGTNGGDITMSYSIGIVTGDSSVGGLIGDNFVSTISSCFWDTQASGLHYSDGGTGLSTAQMQDPNTFINAGWDCIDEVLYGTCDYWQLKAGDYPKLQYSADNGPVMPDGLGTAQEPYLIRDAKELGTVWFEPLACYILETSIDLSGIQWSAAVIPAFEGSFDGNGNIISNLHIEGGDCLGLFGQSGSDAMIFNLGLEAVDVNGTGMLIGSLVGENKGNISTCYSSGKVTGIENVGGLVGWNYGGSITTSYNKSNVSGQTNIGGLVGRNSQWCPHPSGSCTMGYISCCYSIGAVTGIDNIGGLVGNSSDDDSIFSSFWDIETSGQATSAGGIGLTTSEMQTESTFTDAGWDFVGEVINGTEDIWGINEGIDYPRLWWE